MYRFLYNVYNVSYLLFFMYSWIHVSVPDHGCTRTKRGECYTGTHQTTKGGVACDSWQKVKDAGLGLKEYILPLEASLEDSGCA